MNCNPDFYTDVHRRAHELLMGNTGLIEGQRRAIKPMPPFLPSYPSHTYAPSLPYIPTPPAGAYPEYNPYLTAPMFAEQTSDESDDQITALIQT